MNALFLDRRDDACRPLWLVAEQDVDTWTQRLPAADAARLGTWLRANAFRAERHRVVLLPGADGDVAGVVLGLGRLASLDELTPWHVAGLADRLPNGRYYFADALSPTAATQAALGWALGSYRYDRYRRPPAAPRPALVLPVGADASYVVRAAEADALARDLINTPAADLGPAELAAAVAGVANRYGARFRQVVGEQLLTERLPAIHAVGRAASTAPRLAELRWGTAGPRVTIVGKGVCFDTGGLDIKPGSSMALMKKDMGGAACALALAQMVMDARLPVQLRLLVPAVENSIAGNAYRPGDVLQTRRGLTVEVNNTDAEGRLVLCDALALADEERPDLLLDLATLTGAARVALGPELPALYAVDDALAGEALAAGRRTSDPMWQLPLWAAYDDDYSSKVADVANVSAAPFAGSIIAALFLRRFVGETTPWMHVDLYAWNGKERPGRPVGGEAQCVRAFFDLLQRRYRS
jgi:leucyl aminopeptidase